MSSEDGGGNSANGFSSFGLDPRLTRVLLKQNILQPTLIQEKAIPLALAGKDLLAKAKTGSGKTLTYLLPILQQLLTQPKSSIRVLILVPTKELARQVMQTTNDLMHYFPKNAGCISLAGEESVQLQASMLSAQPAVLISTPSRLLAHLEGQRLVLQKTLEFLVIDEGDLILSFGYAADLERIVQKYLPKTVQTFLMSATLTTEIEELKKLVLRNPVILKLEERDEGEGGAPLLQQWVIRCQDDDKFLLMYTALKLKLLKGKILIFTNDVERCFRLRLFLEQFGIKSCVLNAELPVASRHHIVDEFNRGVYDIIIASDLQPSTGTQTKSSKRTRIDADKEYGASRGVDFKQVDLVINFDLPPHPDSYVHRIGRTARGRHEGAAISFICSSQDEQSLRAIEADQQRRGNQLNPHTFDLKQIEGFRYRCGDVLRSITSLAIKEARLRAIKREIVKSEKLKDFFEARPKDLDMLRHDQSTGVLRSRPHLKHIPDYLLPRGKQEIDQLSKEDAFIPINKSSFDSKRRPGNNNRGKKIDPLKSFKLRGKK